MVEESVFDALHRHRGAELWLGGHLPVGAFERRHSSRVRRLPFLHWLELPRALRDVDVNLAPIDPSSRFNQAKSAIKWLEAALVRTPTIASPTQAFADVITDGGTGILASSPDEWTRSIRYLLDDAEARLRMGRDASRSALLDWSPHLQGRRYCTLLERANEWLEQSAHRSTSWPDEALDEPWSDQRVSRAAGTEGSTYIEWLKQHRTRTAWERARARLKSALGVA